MNNHYATGFRLNTNAWCLYIILTIFLRPSAQNKWDSCYWRRALGCISGFLTSLKNPIRDLTRSVNWPLIYSTKCPPFLCALSFEWTKNLEVNYLNQMFCHVNIETGYDIFQDLKGFQMCLGPNISENFYSWFINQHKVFPKILISIFISENRSQIIWE